MAPRIAVYAWGRGKDKPRPRKLTAAQRQAKLRERKQLAILHALPQPTRTQ